MTTLDALIATHGEPAFCKIDVEGFEAEVLAGLTRPLRALSFEYLPMAHDAALAVLELVEKLGPYRYNYSPIETMTLGERPLAGRGGAARAARPVPPARPLGRRLRAPHGMTADSARPAPPTVNGTPPRPARPVGRKWYAAKASAAATKPGRTSDSSRHNTAVAAATTMTTWWPRPALRDCRRPIDAANPGSSRRDLLGDLGERLLFLPAQHCSLRPSGRRRYATSRI